MIKITKSPYFLKRVIHLRLKRIFHSVELFKIDDEYKQIDNNKVKGICDNHYKTKCSEAKLHRVVKKI